VIGPGAQERVGLRLDRVELGGQRGDRVAVEQFVDDEEAQFVEARDLIAREELWIRPGTRPLELCVPRMSNPSQRRCARSPDR